MSIERYVESFDESRILFAEDIQEIGNTILLADR